MQTEHTGRAEPGKGGAGNPALKTTTIVVNGRAREVAAKELTFEEIVRLAFPDAVFNEVTVYTVTFKRGQGEKPEGTLVQGESVKVKEGMLINVARTDKS